jgi:hypothetical protein
VAPAGSGRLRSPPAESTADPMPASSASPATAQKLPTTARPRLPTGTLALRGDFSRRGELVRLPPAHEPDEFTCGMLGAPIASHFWMGSVGRPKCSKPGTMSSRMAPSNAESTVLAEGAPCR